MDDACKRHTWAHNGAPKRIPIKHAGGANSGRFRLYWPMHCIRCPATKLKPGEETR